MLDWNTIGYAISPILAVGLVLGILGVEFLILTLVQEVWSFIGGDDGCSSNHGDL